MTCRIRLVLAIHNHQPVGNFDGVFENACRDSYAPFLDVLEQFPEIPVSLHISGSLLEWLEVSQPEYIDRVRAFCERGQIELLGGPFYEPILSGIPSRDRIGQIATYSQHLQQLFGVKIRGMWVPERVWEQSFASDIAEAGIEYTLLDDFHFRNAGLSDEELHGYYLTEDEGRLVKVFPGSERLRYTIPFAEPRESIEYLRQIGDRFPNAVIALGDDGEKFGTWPGTKEHVYSNGWLKQFFEALRDNSQWLKLTTMAEAVDHVPPVGTCYLPDASYREMTEWALPTQRHLEYLHLAQRKESDPDWPAIRQSMRGGYWRNFRVKYAESNEMYARMLIVSQRLEEVSRSSAAGKNSELIDEARRELYRGQCNCSYWHGAFGGLYLPHLRNAVYKHLISADRLLDKATGRSGRWVQIDADDYNLDARKEIQIRGDRLIAWLAPSRGGHLYELDILGMGHNLLATLNRREEPYHETVREVAGRQREHHSDPVTSIHDAVRFKQPDLDRKLIYDHWPRKSLVDHFLQPGLSFEDFRKGAGTIGDFLTGVYETRLKRSPERVEAVMSRLGQLGPYSVRVTKTVALATQTGGRLEIRYQLENLPAEMPIHFGIEFNFAGMAAEEDDRYYYAADGQRLGQLESIHDLAQTDRIGLIDEWLGLDAAIEISKPSGIWTFPIETVSQSEGGFELVHQSSAVVPHWEFVAPTDGRWEVQIDLVIDTSAAQARKLSQMAAVKGPTNLKQSIPQT